MNQFNLNLLHSNDILTFFFNCAYSKPLADTLSTTNIFRDHSLPFNYQ